MIFFSFSFGLVSVIQITVQWKKYYVLNTMLVFMRGCMSLLLTFEHEWTCFLFVFVVVCFSHILDDKVSHYNDQKLKTKISQSQNVLALQSLHWGGNKCIVRTIQLKIKNDLPPWRPWSGGTEKSFNSTNTGARRAARDISRSLCP